MATKRLEIESANCLIELTTFGFYINGEPINEIVTRALENGLKNDKKYQAYLKVEISAIEEEPLKIKNNWDEKENILFGEDASERKPYANSI